MNPPKKRIPPSPDEWLIHARSDFTHDLEELLDTLKIAGISIHSTLNETGVLTPYAVETRYPGYWGEISESEVIEALEFAEGAIKWAEETTKRFK